MSKSATVRHHPGEETLLAYAAGTLDEATSVLVATHLALCPHCRALTAAAEAVGGEMLDRFEPATLVNRSVGAALTLLDRADAPTITREAPVTSATAVADAVIPRPLRDFLPAEPSAVKWRWMGPGVRYAHLCGAADTGKVGLLRIASGTRLPRHGHTDEEFTMVLEGSYASGDRSYARGDVEWANDAVIHQPTASRDRECVCVVVTRGTLKATGIFAPLVQPLMAI
ncbi:MAG: ChrR family anti-sigma-E factor [Rhodospirillaceae bacterium]|nr:ChrR family anti-sigma-E factor [Rhodospirillaceae bacterium]